MHLDLQFQFKSANNVVYKFFRIERIYRVYAFRRFYQLALPLL